MSGPDSADDAPCGEQPPATPGAIVTEIPIVNKKGLHARASAKFVQTVEQYDAKVYVSRCGEQVGGDSIMGLMMLSAGPGTTIRVEASGAQAQDVLEALAALVGSRFGEED
jgi:phosphocarrier protein HPr